MDSVYDFMKRKEVVGAAGFIVLIVVLIIVFANPEKNLLDRSEPVEAGEVTPSVMQPIVVDTYVYQFEGIDWQFPVEDRGTRVNFMLENFSRTEGSYVTFGNPYKLGFYDGECHEIEGLTYDTESNPGLAIGYAECVAPGMTQQFVLFQQGEEVVAKIRRMYEKIEGYTEPEFITLYTVNLTEIVK
jgi:hypothetical protein